MNDLMTQMYGGLLNNATPSSTIDLDDFELQASPGMSTNQAIAGFGGFT